MIRREAEAGDVRSVALYSDCGAYRYLLRRSWGAGGQLLCILLNPSTASEVRNDPTVARCERRARALGYGGFAVANLFAWRATAPADLRAAADPIGPDNDRVLNGAATEADAILCGWGVHGSHLGRGAEVAARLWAAGHRLLHLGITREGHPRHPLYVAYAARPQPWRE
jgi:hypothetical protein